MAKNNYVEPNKITLIALGGQGLATIFEKTKHKIKV
jgi:hypothetical protein